MSSRRNCMYNYVEASNKVEIFCADGGKVYGEGFGVMTNESLNITIGGVMYVPKLESNLLSVSRLVKSDKVVVFSENGCNIYNKNECIVKGKIWLEGVLDRGVYKLKSSSQESALATTQSGGLELWHKRLAHLGVRNLKLLRDKMATGKNKLVKS
ncbi:uncharacterized protein LOC131847412 [Achroia grisella]|uniref:uncharacterized protein LOC131842572 n=1 Tax=Achroia grisella TaxID=688607 RepID=UPI0027D2DDA9|nr:uncharacterized protein LOC131842572 [Achroia grisella]XP_059052977.1 uncharacterized protein LOC131847412 [Achroia grisella]